LRKHVKVGACLFGRFRSGKKTGGGKEDGLGGWKRKASGGRGKHQSDSGCFLDKGATGAVGKGVIFIKEGGERSKGAPGDIF